MSHIHTLSRLILENEEQNDFRLEGTGFAYTLSLINGKYKMPILLVIGTGNICRDKMVCERLAGNKRILLDKIQAG